MNCLQALSLHIVRCALFEGNQLSHMARLARLWPNYEVMTISLKAFSPYRLHGHL